MRAVTGAVLRALACRLASRPTILPPMGTPERIPFRSAACSPSSARRASARPTWRSRSPTGCGGPGEHPVAVSADALQVYTRPRDLTGVATRAERARLEHRLVSFLPIDARFSVGQYAQLAHAEIDGLLDAGARPIVVGGTGLYLRAALADATHGGEEPVGYGAGSPMSAVGGRFMDWFRGLFPG